MSANRSGAAGRLTAPVGQNINCSQSFGSKLRKCREDYVVFYLTFYGLVSFHEDIVAHGLQISTLTVQPSSDFFATLLILIVSLSLSHSHVQAHVFSSVFSSRLAVAGIGLVSH